MAEITEANYANAYELARAIDAGTITASAAQAQLLAAGMNGGSAQAYLRTIVHIIRGEPFRRTINNSAAAYVLGRIRDRQDPEALRLALASLRSHIQYYRKYGSHNGLQSIVDDFEGQAGRRPHA